MVRSFTSDNDDRRALAHRLMEEALRLLDRTQDSLPAIHLDHAISALGLREPPVTEATIAPSTPRIG